MLNIIHAAIPGFLGSMALEHVVGKARGEKVYEDGKDTLTSLALGIGNVLLEGAAKKVTWDVYHWCYKHRIMDVPLEGPARTVALVFAEDFAYYWFHRASHEVRMFWAAHVNHHSSEKYNLATALRQSYTTPLTKLPFWAPLALIGFHPKEILKANAFNLLYQFWIHTELIERMGPFETIMNTPSHHRVHHGSNLKYLDTNYAGIFIIWDKLFGTFEPEDDAEPVVYGLLHNLKTHNLWTVAFHEWIAMIQDAQEAPTLRQKIRHFFNPPGWSPDGSTHTVDELRRAARASRATSVGSPSIH